MRAQQGRPSQPGLGPALLYHILSDMVVDDDDFGPEATEEADGRVDNKQRAYRPSSSSLPPATITRTTTTTGKPRRVLTVVRTKPQHQPPPQAPPGAPPRAAAVVAEETRSPLKKHAYLVTRKPRLGETLPAPSTTLEATALLNNKHDEPPEGMIKIGPLGEIVKHSILGSVEDFEQVREGTHLPSWEEVPMNL